MPRTGGEADKLGNRYEGVWTVDVLLNVIAGEATSIVVEPIGEEARGCEFVCLLPGGGREVHSVKRQTSQGAWTLARLARPQPSGRSILGDLIAQTQSDRTAVFVSGVAAQGLDELCESARACASISDFESLLARRGKMSGEFIERVVPLTAGDREASFQFLRRTCVRTIGEPELIRRVELRIRSELRTTSGDQLDPRMTRLLLGDIVMEHLGQELTADQILAELTRHGLAPSRYTGAADVRDRLDLITGAYLSNARRTLINQTEIERPEAAAALEALSVGRSVLIEAAAGLGKSCVMVQAIEELRRSGAPCLVLRADTLQSNESSAQAWGRARGLPESPVVTLGKFAGDALSVLCIDQLDAVSVVSARNPTAWALVEELLYEVEQYPNMRLLVACRSFDLQHDPRLQSLVDDQESFARITVESLTREVVRANIEAAGIDVSHLTERQLDLLTTPLHLYLFLDADGDRASFTSRGDLFDRYWEAKERAVDTRAGHQGGWVAGVGALCDALSDGQTLQAPSHVLDAYGEVRAALQSESVVLDDNGRLRFFHESFFDYAFARSFLRQGGDLVAWLVSDEQPLFRRSQVRQVLEFLRDREAERGRYLQALEGLLRDGRIRFHIKKLVLEWLRDVPSPTADEWRALERSVPVVGAHVWSVIRNSTTWFDVVHGLGNWHLWLRSTDAEEINRTITLLWMPNVFEQRSEIVAGLISPFRGRSQEWNQRLAWMMSRGNAYHSPAMEELFLHLVSDGTLDDLRPGVAMNDDWWSTFYTASTAAPEFMVRVLGAWWDRQLVRAQAVGRADPFRGNHELVRHSQFSSHVVGESARLAPAEFAQTLFPRVIALDRTSPQPIQAIPFEIGGPDDQIRTQVVVALSFMSRERPDELDRLISAQAGAETPWIASAGLIAWSVNAERYAETIVEFILADPAKRLDIGYSFAMGDADMLAGVSRTAIAAASPHCSDAAFDALENAILGFTTDWERRVRAVGRTELALLRALPTDRVSAQARRRIQELERRFPEAPERGAPHRPVEDGRMLHAVGPPIPDSSQALMTDDHWLAAMEEYAEDRSELRNGQFVGGAIELSRGLEALVQSNPERVAALVDRMRASINPTYFEAILRGLAPLTDGHRRAVHPGLVWRVIRRITEMGVPVRGTEIARAVDGAVDVGVPADIVELVCRIAVEDPDPAQDTWLEQARRDALTQAINSARGTAAETIARLLFADRATWPQMRSTVERLVADPVLAVRVAAVDCLLAVLDTERKDAIDFFARLADGALLILDTRPIERFLSYAIYREYGAVRPILVHMIASAEPSCVRSGARLMTAAGLWVEGADGDLALVLESGDHARAGAAEVFADGLQQADVSGRCEENLRSLFYDESAEVRKAAGGCWRLLQPDEVAARGSLIQAFAASPAFADGEHMLLFHLRQSRRPLPLETCRLAERAIEVFGDKAASIQFREAADAGELADLMIRLHEETSDIATRNRILDIIDSMMKAGFYGLDERIESRFSR